MKTKEIVAELEKNILINAKIKYALSRQKEEIEGVIEGMKKDERTINLTAMMSKEEAKILLGYNQALTDALKEIEGL